MTKNSFFLCRILITQLLLLFALIPGPVARAEGPTRDAFYAGNNYARPRVVGEPISDALLKDINDSQQSLASVLKGKFTVVIFVHPAIARSLALRTYLNRLEPYFIKLGYQAIAVIPASKEDFAPINDTANAELIAPNRVVFYFDEKRASFHNMGLVDQPDSMEIIPSFYLVGPDGIIRYQHSMIDGSTPFSGEQLLLAAKITKDFYLQRSRAAGIDMPRSETIDESTRDLMQPLPPPDRSLLNLLIEDDLAHSHAYWMQAGLGGSLYNARNNKFDGRWSPGLQFGKRMDRFGYFVNFELDYVFDFTQEVQRLDMIQIGAGVEYLALWGHLRSSLSAGASILNSDTQIDSRGKVGGYVDFRPISVRRKLDRCLTFEFTPLAIDLAVPVTQGIPLVIFHYFTLASLEFSFL